MTRASLPRFMGAALAALMVVALAGAAFATEPDPPSTSPPSTPSPAPICLTLDADGGCRDFATGTETTSTTQAAPVTVTPELVRFVQAAEKIATERGITIEEAAVILVGQIDRWMQAVTAHATRLGITDDEAAARIVRYVTRNHVSTGAERLAIVAPWVPAEFAEIVAGSPWPDRLIPWLACMITRESFWRARAEGKHRERGWTQMHPGVVRNAAHWYRLHGGWDAMFDPPANLVAAWDAFNGFADPETGEVWDGQGTRAWTTARYCTRYAS